MYMYLNMRILYLWHLQLRIHICLVHTWSSRRGKIHVDAHYCWQFCFVTSVCFDCSRNVVQRPRDGPVPSRTRERREESGHARRVRLRPWPIRCDLGIVCSCFRFVGSWQILKDALGPKSVYLCSVCQYLFACTEYNLVNGHHNPQMLRSILLYMYGCTWRFA